MLLILLTRISKRRLLAFSLFPSLGRSSEGTSSHRYFLLLPSSLLLAFSLRGVLWWFSLVGLWGVRCMAIGSLLLNLIITNMLGSHSPEKENRSPEARRKEKHHREIKLLAGKHEEDLHQLRVKVADYEFELKKMGEDFAEFQLLAKMEKDKLVKRLREQLDAERSKNLEDNSKWEKKFAERNEQYGRDCEKYKEKVDEESRTAIAEALSKMHHKHDEHMHQMNHAHEETVKHLNKTIQHLKADFQHRLQTEKENHLKELLSLRKSHETVLKEKQECFESKLVAVESEKKAQIRIVEQAKKESSKLQEKYLLQIGTTEREKRKLEEKLDETEMKCKILTKKLEDRTKEIEALRQLHAEQLQKAELDRNNAMQKARNLLNHEKAQFLRQEYARTEQIQLKLIRLNQSKQQMQHNYDGLLRTLETRFERRQSKRQDIEALRQYEQQLVSKQRENTQIYQQLRMVQLEKENNDKIYTRIFTTKKDKKSLSQKDAHDLHALFKQSNTTDFRHLLKIAQK